MPCSGAQARADATADKKEEDSKRSDKSATMTTTVFHLDSGDDDGGQTGSASGISMARAKGGNEVAAGVAEGRRKACQQRWRRGGDAGERHNFLLSRRAVEYI